MKDAFAAAVMAGLPPLLRGKSPKAALLTSAEVFFRVLAGLGEVRGGRYTSRPASRGVGGRAPAKRAGVIDVEFTEEPATGVPVEPKGLLPPHEEKP